MEDERDYRKPTLARLEEFGIRVMYTFIERDSRFLLKAIVAFFLLTIAPAIAISIFFLGRRIGFFG